MTTPQPAREQTWTPEPWRSFVHTEGSGYLIAAGPVEATRFVAEVTERRRVKTEPC